MNRLNSVMIACIFFCLSASVASGQAPPDVDVKVNGLDAGVLVAAQEHVKIDFDIAANGGTGYPADVWLVVAAPGGFFTYNAVGPVGGWNAGLGHVFYTGPLATMSGTALDMPLPIGLYKVFLGLDAKANGVLDPGHLLFTDMVDFEVLANGGISEDFDDGVANGWLADGPHWFCAKNAYRLDCPGAGYFLSHYYPRPYGDFTVSAAMRMLDTGNAGDRYERGLVLRSDGTLDNGYRAVMNNDGFVVLYLCINSPAPMLLRSAFSSNAITGVGNWNTMAAEVRGSNIEISINGVLEFSVTDSAHLSGYVGLIGQGSSQFDNDYEFDDVQLTL